LLAAAALTRPRLSQAHAGEDDKLDEDGFELEPLHSPMVHAPKSARKSQGEVLDAYYDAGGTPRVSEADGQSLLADASQYAGGPWWHNPRRVGQGACQGARERKGRAIARGALVHGVWLFARSAAPCARR
jgi:hypothetical protein